MNHNLSVAYSELTRVLPWSLRALGYKFGTADRGSHLVATAAATNPIALDAIALAGYRPERGPSMHRTSEGLAIEAGGVSLLEIGPAAVDYLAAHADTSPHQTCTIVGATETALLPAIVAGAEVYGLGCLAIVAGGAWHIGYRDREGCVLVAGDDAGDLPGLLGGDPELALVAHSRGDAPGTVRVLVGEQLALAPLPKGAVRPAQLIRHAQCRGIAVSQATLDAIYGLEMLTWAPTSERSRSQAGFSVNASPQQ